MYFSYDSDAAYAAYAAYDKEKCTFLMIRMQRMLRRRVLFLRFGYVYVAYAAYDKETCTFLTIRMQRTQRMQRTIRRSVLFL